MPFLTAGGHRLEYERIGGDAGAPTLILLHEGLGSVALWRDFPAKLAQAKFLGYYATQLNAVEVNFTFRASGFGCARSTSRVRGNPSHGITIDHASTQRCR